MPNAVSSLWIGRELGAIQQLSLASFVHHSHEFDLYTYGDVARIPRGVTIRDAAQILPESEIFTYQQGPGKGSYAAYSNLFRYKLLLDRGGWWVDADVVCLKPFDFADDVVLASEHTRKGPLLLSNAVMKLPRGHDIARRCYETARARDPQSLNWGDTGPKLLHHVVVYGGWSGLVSDASVFCPLPWWEWERFLEERADACGPYILPETYAVHLWNEMWRRGGKGRPGSFGAASLMAALQRKYLPHIFF